MTSADGRGAPRAEREELARLCELRRQELKRASLAAYQELKGRGLTSGQVGAALGLRGPLIRRLAADGDAGGWRPSSLEVYRKLDGYFQHHLKLADPGLARLRELYDAACDDLQAAELRVRAAEVTQDTSDAGHAVYARELTEYLHALSGTLDQIHAWIPHHSLAAAFQSRAVDVRDGPPRTPADEALYVSRTALARGDVSWATAMRELPVAVVLGDAGYGKTWLLRRHCRELCDAALAALGGGADPATVELPLWMHAGDLARSWSSSAAADEALVLAAMRAPRDHGFTPSPRLTAFLAGRITASARPVHVLVDGYDEVYDSALRDAAGRALSWLHRLSQRDTGPRLVLSSRSAGYASPFGAGEDLQEPRYLMPGVLDEHQVRLLWQRWFEARGEPMPAGRLDPVLAPASPLRDFARVPLIAAFCAWVAEVDVVATSRPGLYEQVVRRFLALPWKTGGPLREDGGRRAELEAALARLAWTMATDGPAWRDAITIADCEAELAAAGLPPPPGHSRSWLAIREVGILVQAAARQAKPLGDAPVLWIHRSVQEFLVARKLITLPRDQIAELLSSRGWMQPEWGEVMHFAIGLEATGGGPWPAADALHSLTLDRQDGLGWFATVLAAASTGRPPDPAVRQAVVDRVWALQRAGFLTPVRLVHVLSLVPEASRDELAGIVLDAPAGRETWEALAWCGEPGRTALRTVIESAPAMEGAAFALSLVDPAAALEALRRRLSVPLPVQAADAIVLRELADEDVSRLRDHYLSEPASRQWAKALGWTRHPLAREALLSPALRAHKDPAVRRAVMDGITAYAGNELDPGLYRIIADAARSDADRTVRLAARNSLRTIAMSVPWVEQRLDDEADAMNEDPTEPELKDLESIAARLRSVGPATMKTVVMLLEEPRLCQGPVPEAMMALAARTLNGELDVETTRFVADFVGPGFAELACGRLRDPALAEHDLANLAVGVLFASEGDLDVYAAVADYAGRHPQLLLEGALRMPWQDPLPQAEVILSALSGLAAPAAGAVQIWADVLRGLILDLPGAGRRELRARCAAATEHVLALAKD